VERAPFAPAQFVRCFIKMASNVPAQRKAIKQAFSAGKLLKKKQRQGSSTKMNKDAAQARFHTFLSLDAC
jgi:hypothetical protein